MRKFQQVALVVAAASGLSAIGAGPAIGATPVAYNGAAPPPVPQPDAQADALTSSQASAQTSGSAPQQQAAPQRPAEVSPQVSPQLNPQISPKLSSPAPQTQAPAHAHPQNQQQHNLFRPAQECSPQNLLDANLPIAVLAAAETQGVNCGQANSQSNTAASARS
ncbi:hypothetical protein [Streptomyces sp. NPDC002851]